MENFIVCAVTGSNKETFKKKIGALYVVAACS